MARKVTGKKNTLASPSRLNRTELCTSNEFFSGNCDKGYPICVAEGDSWFDYPGILNPGRHPENDVLDFLTVDHKLAIYRIARHGDTLNNMVYNTLQKQVIDAITRIQPEYFLFSGGGNDIAGPDLKVFLIDSASARGMAVFREKAFSEFVNSKLKLAYEHMLKRVTAAKKNIKIVGHGYDYAPPNGKPVIDLGWFGFVGPWLKPQFLEMHIENPEIHQEIVRLMIDIFNEMLIKLKRKHSNFHFVDSRGLVRKDWANELHPNKAGFRRIAKAWKRVIG